MERFLSRQKIVGLIVAGSFLMQTLDATIVATALPEMSVSLGTSPVHLSIAITAYLLSLAVSMPLAGWLADRFGGRAVLVAALTVFTIGSILCGISTSVFTLTAARIVQGTGGAMLAPVARMVLLNSRPREDFVRATTGLQIITQIGPLLGPPIGGFITTYASWRWIFLINAPIGIAAIFFGLKYIEKGGFGERRPLDWLGFLLSGGTLCCIMYAMEILAHHDSGSVMPILGLFAAGLVLGVAALWHARTEPFPILDFALLRSKTYAINISGGSLYRFGAGALVYLLPLLLQLGLGLNPFMSGLMLLASAVGAVSISLFATRILKHFSFRTVLGWNGSFCVASIFLFVLMVPGTPWPVIGIVLLVGGLVRSLQYMYLNAIAYAEIPTAKMSDATTFASMVQQLCNGFGVAIAAIVLHLALAWRGATDLTMGDFQFSFFIAGLLALAAVPFFATLAPDAGAELRGIRTAPGK